MSDVIKVKTLAQSKLKVFSRFGSKWPSQVKVLNGSFKRRIFDKKLILKLDGKINFDFYRDTYLQWGLFYLQTFTQILSLYLSLESMHAIYF